MTTSSTLIVTPSAAEPIPSFESEAAAEKWMEEYVDDTYIDNRRIGYLDDSASRNAYLVAQNQGCCGSFDEQVIIAGRRAMIGCNFGH